MGAVTSPNDTPLPIRRDQSAFPTLGSVNPVLTGLTLARRMLDARSRPDRRTESPAPSGLNYRRRAFWW